MFFEIGIYDISTAKRSEFVSRMMLLLSKIISVQDIQFNEAKTQIWRKWAEMF